MNARTVNPRTVNLAVLHLCDSLFPIGAFAHSDGLESATADGRIASADDLRAWLAVCLDESIGRLEGPTVWRAWSPARDGDALALAALDEELTALRPSSAARQSSRAMGKRLLTTWRALHADERLSAIRDATALPIAFAAMRLLPLGQIEAHALLARVLERVPQVVDRIAARGGGALESFAPALDLAAMSHQYVHSRLFRS